LRTSGIRCSRRMNARRACSSGSCDHGRFDRWVPGYSGVPISRYPDIPISRWNGSLTAGGRQGNTRIVQVQPLVSCRAR
jgi:hypothetical protein